MGGKELPAEMLERWRARARSLLNNSAAEAAAEQPAVPTQPDAAVLEETEAPGDAAQRRRTARQKTLIGAKVVFNDMMSVFDCAVRDLSESGARLKLNAPVQVPQVFTLRFSDGRIHKCKVRRRNALELGVEFID